ncbi:hypothetical protein GBA52_002453 [Prunus armeniaca]|nr:hypothetical protein GBA52_002453 [Prunus armeniaca]
MGEASHDKIEGSSPSKLNNQHPTINTPSNNNNNMHHCMNIPMGGLEVHKVVPPPRRSTLQKLMVRLKETFFPDDPLHQFKGQPPKKQWILGAQYVFPILEWGPTYSFKLLKSDIISGITIASLAIPQGISYAKLANLPAIVGLYSSFVPPLVYAVLGSSKDLAVGPVSIASLIMGSMLMQEVSPTKDPNLFLQLAFTSTFFSGIIQASLGLLRLGFIIDFLSKATLIGFMAGAAVIVSLQQLKSLLGIQNFTKKMAIVPVLSSVFEERKEWSWQTILMGVCFLLLLLIARHVSMRKPKLFWVSAGAPLASVILSTVIVFAFKANRHGISVIGDLQKGLNPPSWNMLIFSGTHIGLVIKTGIITGIIALTGLAIAVGISVFKILLQVTRPRTVVLGNIPGTDVFRDLHHYNESAVSVPGFLIISIEAAINFANTTYLNERILRWIEEEEDDGNKHPNIRFVIIDMSAVSSIDTTGITLFGDLRKAIRKKGLVLVNPLAEVVEKLQKVDKDNELMRPDHLYLSVGEAIASLSMAMKNQASNMYDEEMQTNAPPQKLTTT